LHKVYIELVFLDNFLINLLILLLTARLTSLKARWRRFILSAAAGGVYACAAVLFGGILASLYVKAAAAFAMCFIGFWTRGEKRFIVSVCAFWAVSFVFAGAIYASMLSFGEPSVIGGAIVVRPPARYILLGLFAGAALITVLSRIRRNIKLRQNLGVNLTLKAGERKTCVKAFVDTGNLVKEPLSGCGVIFLSRAAARELLDEKTLHILTAKEYTQTDKLRIVPCSTAAGKELFFGIEIDEAVLFKGGAGMRAVVCIAKNMPSGGFGAIVGGDMIDELKRGENNEDDVVPENYSVGDAAVGVASRHRLHKRQRGAPAAAFIAGGDRAAAAAGGGGQVGKADID